MIEKPRGTRDFVPDDMEKRRWLESTMQQTFKRFGYKEIATPTFEHLDLFTLKSGVGIIEETYTFEDKSGRKLALRPELTVPAMRMYVEQFQMNAKPMKVYYFGNCFRYDRPQKGRYREFWQFGCELIGSDRPVAIAELITLAYTTLKDCGLKNLILRIGNLDILRRFLDSIGARNADIMRLIDKKDMDELKKNLKPKDFDKFINFININDLSKLSFEEAKKMQIILSFLEEFSVPYNIDFSIARGLDYYVETVFEIDAPKLGAERQLCGGGSYNLVPLLGGKKIPTSGFAIGFDRTLIALDTEKFSTPSAQKPLYVSYMEDMTREAIKITRLLRQAGITVDMDVMGRSIKKALDYADRMGMARVIIIAPDEWKRGNVAIKNMKTGDQKELPICELVKYLTKL